MRLIDADKLKEEMNKKYSEIKHISLDFLAKGFILLIDNQPTAYDVDKVVKQLEELKEDAEWGCEAALDDRRKEIAINRAAAFLQAVDIVKKGGVE